MREASSPASSVLLLALGQTVYPALEAAATLAKDGIDATVVNARFVKPLDTELITKLAPAHQLTFTIEDHMISGGFGSAVLECLSHAGIQAPLVRLGIDDFFVPHGTQQELRRLCGFDAEGVYMRVRQAMRDMGALPMKREGSRR
jgi:1-deoxy-D-xylulose-5-phosphate synthase